MSLIMEALKKAQQLRSNEPKSHPLFRQTTRERKDRKKYFWRIAIAAISLSLILLIAWRFLERPSLPPQNPTLVIAERVPVPAEPDRPLMDLSKIEKPTVEDKKLEAMTESPPSNPSPPASLPSDIPDVPKREVIKPSSQGTSQQELSIKPKLEEKVETSPKKEEKPSSEEKPSLSPSPKEEVISKPLIWIQGSGKDHPLKTEVVQYFNKGVYHYQQGEVSKAIQAYQKAVDLDPSFVEAYNNLGIIFQEMGDLESAFKSYRKAIEVDPHYVKSLNNLGIIHYLRGEDGQAIDLFKKALSINPDHIETHIHLGTLYKKMGQSEKGIESYQKALAINPHHGETHYNLGLLYEQIGKTDLAIHHYKQFVLLAAGTYPALVARVRSHMNQLMKK